MMIILTIVILKLLIIFNIYNRLGVINKSNGKHFKKDRWRILAWARRGMWDWYMSQDEKNT